MRFVVRRKSAERIFLHLNAHIGDAAVRRGGELALRCRSDLQPIARRQRDFLAVDNRLALACKNAVNLLVLLMGMDERNARTRRKLVDADLCASQAENIMEFGARGAANVRLRVVCHRIEASQMMFSQGVLLIPLRDSIVVESCWKNK